MITLKLMLFDVETELLIEYIAGIFPILPLFVQGQNAKSSPAS